MHAAGGVPRRPGGQLAALQQHPVAPARLGEVKQLAAADDAAADDHDLGMRFHGCPCLTAEPRRPPAIVAPPALFRPVSDHRWRAEQNAAAPAAKMLWGWATATSGILSGLSKTMRGAIRCLSISTRATPRPPLIMIARWWLRWN